MIQRIQSLWLLIAALVFGLLLKYPFAGTTLLNGGEQLANTGGQIFLFIIAIVLTVSPIVAIFLYKNRSNQKKIIWVSLLLNFLFMALMYLKSEDMKELPGIVQNSFTYKPAAVLPIVYLVLLVMAYSGIRKDEKLIKSVDRLR